MGWFATLLIGFLGGVFGVLYRDSVLLARKVQLTLTKVDVWLLKIERVFRQEPFSEYYETAEVLYSKVQSAMSEGTHDPVEWKRKLRSLIDELHVRNPHHINETVTNLPRLLEEERPWAERTIMEETKELEYARAELSMLDDDTMMALPRHIVFQAHTLRDAMIWIDTWLIGMLREVTESDHRADHVSKKATESWLEFVVVVLEAIVTEKALAQNIRRYHCKNWLLMALSLMFRGKA